MIDRSLNYGRAHIARFLRRVDRCNTVLDLGAGRGADLAAAALAFPAADRHAIEIFPAPAEALRQQNVSVHQLNIERDPLPFDDSTVDIIIANQIIEHVKEVFWIFHEASRILRPGGAFLIGVPNLASLHNRVLLAVGRQPTTIRTASAHVRGFTRPDLLGFVEDAFPGGYQLADFGGGNFYPFPPVLAMPLARLFPTFAVAIFFMLVKSRDYSGGFLAYPKTHQLETNFWVGAAGPA